MIVEKPFQYLFIFLISLLVKSKRVLQMDLSKTDETFLPHPF